MLATAVAGAFALAAGAAAASPPTLQSLVSRDVPAVEAAAEAARTGDPDAVQARYDTARALQAALAARGSPDCPELLRHLSRYATANVRAAEAFDRLRPTLIPRYDTGARAALGEVRRSAGSCRRGRLVRLAAAPPLAAAERRAAAVLSNATSTRPPSDDPRLRARLGNALRGFDGEAAAWVHDLRTGSAAGVGADDRYPAASTVKLGLLVAALARIGSSRAVAHDLEAMTSWSSNLAANRLRELVGGDAAIEETLHRLGAATSSYPGPYRAGTSRAAPPLVSSRVTTARDLGRLLARLHGAALGRAPDLQATQLTKREARIAVGLLMGARDEEGALVPSVPAARKHGWLLAARHTAAVLYGPRGPVVVVLLTYREGLTAREAQRLGRRVLAVALRRPA